MWGYGRVLLEKLLNKVNVGHHHAPAAVALQPELVHSITTLPSVTYPSVPDSTQVNIPIFDVVIDKPQVSLPEISYHLDARQLWLETRRGWFHAPCHKKSTGWE